MDSEGLSDVEYVNKELDELMQKNLFDSSESDEDADTMMIMSIQKEMEGRWSIFCISRVQSKGEESSTGIGSWRMTALQGLP